MSEPIKIEALSDETLKAMCYEQIVAAQQAQANLALLEAELRRREENGKNK